MLYLEPVLVNWALSCSQNFDEATRADTTDRGVLSNVETYRYTIKLIELPSRIIT